MAVTGLSLWIALVFAAACAGASTPDAYDVVWDTPSRDSSGSMPLGNGDIGINVWVEQDGDLLLYIGKTDAWSENARLLKLGRVRVKLSPNPFVEGAPFRQVLRLSEGAVTISAGKGPAETRLRVWVDANHPVVRVEAEKDEPFEMTVSLEVWRMAERQLTGKELFSAYGLDGAPHPVFVMPDTVLANTGDRIAWCHRNERSIWRETLELQGMGKWAESAADPLLHRTFGGAIRGEGFVAKGPMLVQSRKPARQHRVAVYCLTAQTPSADAWLEQLEKSVAETERTDWRQASSAQKEWWREFWQRSWIRVSGDKDAEVVSRGYALQRFISACGGRGAFPVKFNGSIFTVDAREKDMEFDADFRAWGGPYWFQNTRLIYWPMLASGDFEMMRPLFRMFADALPFAKARTPIYFGHEGAFFPETMYFWGAYANDNYGWNREGKHVSQVDNTYIRWHWEGQLELLALMIDYYVHTMDDVFLRDDLLPMAEGVLAFFDRHYGRDIEGRLLFKPAQALETWQNVVNPLPEIAGLRSVLDGLLALPDGKVSEAQRAAWAKLRGEIPPLPMREAGGVRVLSPAQEILGPKANSENPELYAIFPFRLYGVGKADLELGRGTFEKRLVKGNNGWRQDDTQAAFLGLAEQARRYVSRRFANKNPGSRFPAFWGPNFDWIPDQDHGCNGEMALQTMLLQAEGKKIRLFPAWPRAWDVEFKLHAPHRTTIEARLRNGKVERLKVDPPERKADVEVLPAQ